MGAFGGRQRVSCDSPRLAAETFRSRNLQLYRWSFRGTISPQLRLQISNSIPDFSGGYVFHLGRLWVTGRR